MEKPKSPKSAKLSLASSRAAKKPARAKPGPARKPAARRPRIPYSKEEIREIFRRFRSSARNRRANSSTSIPTPWWSPSRCPRRPPMPASTRRRALFEAADTPEKMLALGEEKVGDYIRTIGLWRNKAKNVIALSQKLVDEFGGEVPRTREELVTLPGVGRKTANVVMSMAFGVPTWPSTPTSSASPTGSGSRRARRPTRSRTGLMRVIPEEYLFHAHHWLILHGRYCCKARKPECERCVIADICKSKEKTCDIPAPLVELPAQIV
jgi:endonuclease-3